MRRVLILMIAVSVGIFASSRFKDSDMDGIIDRKDKCKHTPFFDIVDRKGCTVKSLAARGRK